MDLDRVPLWRGDHVGVKQLWSDFAQYLYLPRAAGLATCCSARSSDGAGALDLGGTRRFAYAEGSTPRRAATGPPCRPALLGVSADGLDLLVKPEVGDEQLDAAADETATSRRAKGQTRNRRVRRPDAASDGRRWPTSAGRPAPAVSWVASSSTSCALAATPASCARRLSSTCSGLLGACRGDAGIDAEMSPTACPTTSSDRPRELPDPAVQDPRVRGILTGLRVIPSLGINSFV